MVEQRLGECRLAIGELRPRLGLRTYRTLINVPQALVPLGVLSTADALL